MAGIHQLIECASQTHVIRTAPKSYVDAFIEAANAVYGDNLESVLQAKFFIPDDSKFSLRAFQSHASELSVQYHLRRHPSVKKLIFEAKVNPPKDVEAAFEVNGISVALEVKCAEEMDQPIDSIEVRTAGRVPNFRDQFDGIRETLESSDASKKVLLGKNKDNTLREFLTEAQAKFSPESGVQQINILFIGCGNKQNLNEWFLYLKGDQGLFTPKSFFPTDQFRLVDVVILSNLKYWHAEAQAYHDWTLNDVFLLPFVNPARRKACLSSSLSQGLSVFNHHLQRFGHFRPKIDASIYEQIGDATNVLRFIGEELTGDERKRYFPTI
jgi:hypothetical protein